MARSTAFQEVKKQTADLRLATEEDRIVLSGDLLGSPEQAKLLTDFFQTTVNSEKGWE